MIVIDLVQFKGSATETFFGESKVDFLKKEHLFNFKSTVLNNFTLLVPLEKTFSNIDGIYVRVFSNFSEGTYLSLERLKAI